MRPGMIRSRWAAIGAAVAVTLGGGGVWIASAAGESAPQEFVSMTPQRVLDTREAVYKQPALTSGQDITLSLTKYVPNTAVAVALNLTVVDGTGRSYLTLYPTGITKPFVSSINWSDAEAVANSVVVKLGTNQSINIFNNNQTVNVVIDISGYYVNASAGAGAAGPAGPAGPAGADGEDGAKGDKGDTGEQGPSSIVQVKDLNGDWKARATDVAGLKMTGDGIQFGPFADGGECDDDGLDYARLDYSGMNGKTLNDLKSLVYHAMYIADTDTGGVGSPTVRVFFSGNENGASGNRLTFSPNTQTNHSFNYDDEQGEMHEWVVTSGTVRLNDDPGNNPAGELPWASFMATFGNRTIENINVLNGCQAGINLTSLIRRFEINGTTYQFGATG